MKSRTGMKDKLITILAILILGAISTAAAFSESKKTDGNQVTAKCSGTSEPPVESATLHIKGH